MMFLWEGRTVRWRGRKVVVIHCMDNEHVLVCLASRPQMRLMVKRKEIERNY